MCSCMGYVMTCAHDSVLVPLYDACVTDSLEYCRLENCPEIAGEIHSQ